MSTCQFSVILKSSLAVLNQNLPITDDKNVWAKESEEVKSICACLTGLRIIRSYMVLIFQFIVFDHDCESFLTNLDSKPTVMKCHLIIPH